MKKYRSNWRWYKIYDIQTKVSRLFWKIWKANRFIGGINSASCNLSDLIYGCLKKVDKLIGRGKFVALVCWFKILCKIFFRNCLLQNFHKLRNVSFIFMWVDNSIYVMNLRGISIKLRHVIVKITIEFVECGKANCRDWVKICNTELPICLINSDSIDSIQQTVSIYLYRLDQYLKCCKYLKQCCSF